MQKRKIFNLNNLKLYYKKLHFYFISLTITISLFITIFSCSTTKINNNKFYFKYNDYLEIYLTEPYKFKYGKSPIENRILKLLDNAKNEIYIFAFDIDDSFIINKLIEKSKKGVKVKIIIDPDNTPEKVIPIFKHFNMLINYNPPKLMHHKIILIDNNISTLGSMNFTVNGIYFNNNDFIIIKSNKLNHFLKQYFLFLGNQNPNFVKHYISLDLNNINSSLYLTRFKDIDVNTIISNYIKKATKNIYFAYSTFTNKEIANLIINKVDHKNIPFFGLLEKIGSYSKYSVYNLFYANRLKIYRDENESIMHLKTLIIDNYVITGSYAIANRSNKKGYLNRYNDDLIIIFNSEDIASFYRNYIRSLIY